jgi:hypothetical protein
MAILLDHNSNPLGDIGFQAILNQFKGAEELNMTGVAHAVGIAEQVLWPCTAITVYPFASLAGGIQVKVSSTDTDDTLLGAGARTVLVSGLDVNYFEIDEIVELDGQTEVLTAAKFFRINQVQVLSTGVTGSNEGSIWVGTGDVIAGVPATKFYCIEPGKNLSAVGVYTVPAEASVLISDTIASVNTGRESEIDIVEHRVGIPAFYSIHFDVTAITVSINLKVPGIFYEKTDVEFRAKGVASGTNVSLWLHGLLIRDSFLKNKEYR